MYNYELQGATYKLTLVGAAPQRGSNDVSDALGTRLGALPSDKHNMSARPGRRCVSIAEEWTRVGVIKQPAQVLATRQGLSRRSAPAERRHVTPIINEMFMRLSVNTLALGHLRPARPSPCLQSG